MIVCTKIENGGSSLLEFCPCDTEREQLFSLEDLVDRVQSLHNLDFIYHQIRNLGDGHHLLEEISMDLFDLNSEIKTVKYRLYILDRGIESANKFAAFIVPPGRSVCYKRLKLIHLFEFTYFFLFTEKIAGFSKLKKVELSLQMTLSLNVLY